MRNQGLSVMDIGDLFDALFADVVSGRESFNKCYTVSNFPPTNVFINKETKALKFELAMSGYKQSEIELYFDNDKMVIELKKEKKEEVSEWDLLKKGITSANAKINYVVPFNKYEVEKATATFKDGMLTVQIPLKPEVAPKKVTISNS